MATPRKEPRRRYADSNWLRRRFRRQLPNSVGEADSVEGLKKIYVEPVKRPRILRGRGASGSAINNGNGVVGPAIAAARSAASSTPPCAVECQSLLIPVTSR
jgi:hypothetical protein